MLRAATSGGGGGSSSRAPPPPPTAACRLPAAGRPAGVAAAASRAPTASPLRAPTRAASAAGGGAGGAVAAASARRSAPRARRPAAAAAPGVDDIFRSQWETYQIILRHDHLRHAALYGPLPEYVRARLQLASAAPAQQRFSALDLGCGDSQVLAEALEAAGGIWERCGSFTGVDMSPAAMAIGSQNLARVLPPGAALRHVEDDMRAYVAGCPPASVDLAFASFSVHHLVDSDKAALLAGLRRALRPGGVALVVDIFREDDGSQSRGDYMEAYLPQIRGWAGLSPEAVANVTHHVATYDQPATVPFYREAAAAAGFSAVRVLAHAGAFYRTLALEV